MPASRRRQRERAFFYGSLLVLLLFGLLQAKTGEKQYYFCGQREEKAAFEASITFA